VAEGIAIGKPMRGAEIIRAVRESGGDIIAVADEAVLAAQEMMAKRGIYIEPTSGSGVAGALQYFAAKNVADRKIAVPLTGFGLKK
jgi:threonine synthase